MKDFKSGHYVNQGYYKSFQPEPINRQWEVNDMELLAMLSQADRELGRLDMHSEYVPNMDLFIKMHVFKEATKSSRIEGTQTRIAEALMDEEDVVQERRDDWLEVQNYIAALHQSTKRLDEIPISTRLIREAHKVLMQGARGEHKLPGEFRTSQNWIGGASINDATFVPPVQSSVHELMSDLEKFIHNTNIYMPPILRIALVHYQFETIHPFLDGNGRIGRLIIPLFFVERKILKQPILYLSDFFERNRTLYYDNLMRVREKHDMLQWFKFFTVGIIETAKRGIETFDNILKLQKEYGAELQTLGARAVNANKLIESLYVKPITDAHKTVSVTGLSYPSAYTLLGDLERLGIIKELTGAKRGRSYSLHRYLELFEE